MKQRFKNKHFNEIYWLWVSITKEQVEKTKHPGSNRDQAFRDGYVGFRCKYQRNWILYPIYIAGKEWRLINKTLCPDCNNPIKQVRMTSELNTDWYGKLVYYKCPSCKEEFVSRRGGELEIAANK